MIRGPGVGRGTALATLWVVALVMGSACAPPPLADPIPAGEPGASGPCEVVRRDTKNPLQPMFAVTVFEPAGAGAPWTGGRCDDAHRPVALFAHGWLANLAEFHEGFFDHLTSNGFVVVFADYPNALMEGATQYPIAEAGFAAGLELAAGRADTSRLGVIGHSYGGGMVPWLLQRAGEHQWGSASLWAVVFAPHYAQLIPEGPFAVPPQTHMLVVAYQNDSFVDARIGIEMLEAADLPASQKRHLMVVPDYGGTPARSATHLAPLSFEFLPVRIAGLSTDDEDPWAVYRPTDITARCALDGTWCDADLEDMGRWPDGIPVNRSIASTTPADRGVASIQECGLFLNVRGC